MSAARSERFIFNSKLKEEKDYWLDRLSSSSGPAALRPDFERTTNPLGAKATLSLTVPEEITRNLIEFTSDSPQSLYATVLAALKISLYKYTGIKSVVIGSPALRITNETSSKPNVLTMIDEVDGRQSFKTLLDNVSETLNQAYARQSYPFERLITDLGLERNSAGFPLFDIALALETFHQEMPELENDLTILLRKSAEGIAGEIKYQPELFLPETIERFATHFTNILDGGLKAPLTQIRDLQMLSDDELHQVITEWNQTSVAYDENRCVHELIEEQAFRTPDAVALVCGKQEMTYQELNQRANQLARYLQEHGVGLESRVAICVGRSLDMIVSVLGTLKAGAAYVPLDPQYPAPRLAYMLSDSRAQVLLTHSHLLDRLPETDAPTVCLDTEWNKISDYSSASLPGGAHAENAAYMIYTSGSTGQPKGVVIQHGGLANLVPAQKRAFQYSPSSRVLQVASFGFDSSVTEIFTALYSGSALHLGPQSGTELAAEITKVLRDEAITVATLPAALLAVTEVEPLPDLETIGSAGAACPVEAVDRWGRGRRFINAYGPTEATVCCAMMECNGVYTKVVPIGPPADNTQFYVLDPDMQAMPVGVTGELYIGGDCLARGYFSRPDLTAEKFVPDPFSRQGGKRLYRTGDSARWIPSGVIEFLGRVDRQVKVRGFRIELGEVETAIKRMPAVREVLVGLTRDGAGLVAYVVTDGVISGEQIRDSLQTQLPPFMVPGQVVLLERLPLTRHGKVDETALQALAESAERGGLTQEGGAPLSETEQTVAEVWSSILSLDGLGRQANFFDLGGHSLQVTQVIARIRSAFGFDVPVDVLFEHATVADFAAQLEAIRQTNGHSRAPIDLMSPREEGEL